MYVSECLSNLFSWEGPPARMTVGSPVHLRTTSHFPLSLLKAAVYGRTAVHWTALRAITYIVVWVMDALPWFIISFIPGMLLDSLSTWLSSQLFYNTQLQYHQFSGPQDCLSSSIIPFIMWYFHVLFLHLCLQQIWAIWGWGLTYLLTLPIKHNARPKVDSP